jgi:hypothetical protein
MLSQNNTRQSPLAIILGLILFFGVKVGLSQWRSRNIEVVSSISPGGRDIGVKNNYLYLLKRGKISIIDISNIYQPVEANSLNVEFSDYFKGWCLTIRENLLLLSGYGGFKIFDLSNPLSPQRVGVYQCEGDSSAQLMIIEAVIRNNYVVALKPSADLLLIDIRNPRSPRKVGFLSLDWEGGEDIVGWRNYAVAVGHGLGLRCVDISVVDSPQEVGRHGCFAPHDTVDIKDDYAFVGIGMGGIEVIDISSPDSPETVTVYDTPGWATDVTIMGNLLLLADKEGGLRVIDIRSPRFPEEIGYLSFSTGYVDVVESSNNYIFTTWRSPEQVNPRWECYILKYSPQSIEKKILSLTKLGSHYPNPFNPECWIPVGRMEEEGRRGKVKIYNILGQLVRELEYSKVQEFKDSRVYWDGKDSQGLEVPSGVYFYEIDEEEVRRMVVLR